MKTINKHSINLTALLLGLILLNIFGNYFYKRFDLTQDQRFTLSEAAKSIIETVDSPIVIDVFLKGNFPAEFKRLQTETKQLLEEFSAFNSHIKYEFINPLENEENPVAIQQQLQQMGLTTAQVEVRENGKLSTELVYPWALAYYKEKTVKIPLLKNQLGITSEERVNNSIQNLEYAFADGFNKLIFPKKRKIAVLKGNGELEDRYIADFFKTLKEYYYIAPFTLDSVAINPAKTLTDLQGFDMIVVAQPSEAFSDSEKYILDQYIMNGGASLWLLDANKQRTDPTSGKTYAVAEDLQLNDLFFKYGLRMNSNLIKDVVSAPIVLASGNENDSQYNRYPWFYYPISASDNTHPIITNIEAVKFEYASSIDTLPNTITKTVLLSSSSITKLAGLPIEISYDIDIPKFLKVMEKGPSPQEFNSGAQTLAVLMEGEFTSAFANRVKPFILSEDRLLSQSNSMVVVSDGDIIKNQFKGNRPLEVGFDKMTQTMYGNKDFLLNTVNYLLDDSGLINIRTKEIAVPFLDPQKTASERTKWQLINLLLPLGILTLFGFGFNFYRKRKYTV